MSDAVTTRPAICLNMIVRNEAHIVRDVLAAVAPYISSWVIVDTGSQDGTQDLIRNHMDGLAIPGELHERPWRNFGHNRSEAMTLAQGHGDYIWVMDADDTITGIPDFTRLDADVYYLRNSNPSGDSFWTPQLFHDGVRVRWLGVTHEYAEWDDSCVSARLEGDYHVEDRQLSSRNKSGQKLAEDRDLLLAEVERDPDDVRSVFYLAQSYFCMDDFVNARSWYQRRVEMGGWDEEVYFAMYRVAESMSRLGEPWPGVQDAYLRAWAFRPTRAEPLHAIAYRYRLDERYRLGYLFAKRAVEIPFPEQETLFLRADIYNWRAADEQAVCASWIDKPEEAFTLWRGLLARADVPDDDRQRIANNLDVCASALIEAATRYPAELCQRLPADPHDGDVVVSLVAGPDLAGTELTLNSFLHCCTDVSQIRRVVAVDAGMSDEDRATLRERYSFLEFADNSPENSAVGLERLRAQLHERFWLHLEQGCQFFAPDNFITRLTSVLEAEPHVVQAAINLTEAARPTGSSAAEDEVRHAPGAGRYVMTHQIAYGPAMFDTTRLGRAGGLRDTDADPIAELGRRATAAGLRTASLDDAICLTSVCRHARSALPTDCPRSSPYDRDLDPIPEGDPPYAAEIPPASGGGVRPAICLNMIVRDQADTIEQTLDELAPHINSWVIVDTGSKDGTQDLIRNYMRRLRIPGELYERPWRSFADNRSEALALAQGHGDYIWVSDADETLVGRPDFTRLSADVYWLRYGRDDEYLWHAKLFRDGLEVRHEGLTREYAAWDRSCVDVRLTGDYHIESRRLGPHATDRRKQLCDHYLLLAEVSRDPENPQAAFYLAQSYFNRGDFGKAREWYQRRAEMDGWYQETYFAKFRLAESMANLGESWPEVQEAFLRAWEYRPTRAEPLHEIARSYRVNERFLIGYEFARRAAEIPFPAQDQLFVQDDVYAWRALDEQAMCASWTARHAEAFTLYRRLLTRPDLPEEDRQRFAVSRDSCVPALFHATARYPDVVVQSMHRPATGPSEADVVVSLIAGPDRYDTELMLNSFLGCCTDVSRVTRLVAVDVGLSDTDREILCERYAFLQFADAGQVDSVAAGLTHLRALIDGRFWLHLGQGWRFFAPERLITRLTAILETEPAVFQAAINFADAVELSGTSAAERTVRHAPGAGRYVVTDDIAHGPAMFDTTRLDRAGGLPNTDPDPITELGRRATAAGLRTATLDEVFCIVAV